MTHHIVNVLGKGLDSEARKMLEQTAKIIDVDPASGEDLMQRLGDATVLLTGLSRRIDKEIIDAAPNLRILATPTTGTDHLDMEYAHAKGIRVVSLRGETEFLRGVTATAELTWGLLLSLVRKIAPASGDVLRGDWHRQKWQGHSLAGQTLGIAGVGRLGTMVAAYGNAFGMNVIGFDTDVSKTACPLVSFEELLEQSDVLSIHLPLTAETESLFDAKAFAKMKTSAIIVNTARGGIMNEIDLLAALKEGKVAGYAADVLVGETEMAGDVSTHPLVAYARTNANVLITPHIGGMTVEARKATDLFIARNILTAMKEEDQDG